MQELIFNFGDSDHSGKKITANTLDEAVNEFILGCIDFSEYAYSNNPLSDKHLDEPIGYTNGIKNKKYAQHRFYELIPVYCKGKLVKEITLTEFRNWHLRQENILENKAEPTIAKNELTAHSMIQMNRHIINTSMKIRQIKLDMALERKHNLLSTNAKMKAMQTQMEKVKQEYAHLQKKMNILKTYVGIGRDIVKIRSGKKSDKETIDIFQSFRYMKEDIEILTDFKSFDARNLEDFDAFIKDHYQELLPSEKCIQAFKVTDQLIRYNDIFMQQTMNSENKKVYLLIRNGENVYRIFNSYDLHNDYLFMIDDPTESVNQLIEDLIRNRSFSHRQDFEAIKDSYDAKISMGEWKGEWDSGGRNSSYYSCEIPFEYDEKLLSTMNQDAEDRYNQELTRREEYIQRYGLQEELNIYSWRWGISLGTYKQECNQKLLKIRHKMEVLKAYKENDYFTIYALINNSTNTYMYFRINDDEYELKPYDDGIAFTDYCTHRDSKDKNDFSDDFDPITAEPLIRYGLWYDYDKYKEDALEEAKEKIKNKLEEQNFKNFNSVAILQNILDSGVIFNDLPMIDLIVGKGIEVLNFIRDGGNLLSSTFSNVQPPFIPASSLKKGDKIYIVRSHGNRIVRGKYGEGKEIASFGDKMQVVLVDVKKVDTGSVSVHGYLDVYKNYNHENGICAGNAKLSVEIIKDDWLIIKGDIKEEEILRLLKNRHFRESQFENAQIFKEVLHLIRSKKSYNFSGGVDYCRW